MIIFPDSVLIQGSLLVNGTKPAPARSELTQDDNAVYPLPWHGWRIWDAQHTNLPGAGASDDLGLIGGTFGPGTPSLQTGDVKTLGAQTRYARQQFALPPEYVTGQSVTVRVHAGMLTTQADNSATVDVEVYKSNREAGQSGTDLVTTNAQSINNTTLADKSFAVTPTTLVAGDILDIRVAIATNDAASASVVNGIIGAVELLLDIKG